MSQAEDPKDASRASEGNTAGVTQPIEEGVPIAELLRLAYGVHVSLQDYIAKHSQDAESIAKMQKAKPRCRKQSQDSKSHKMVEQEDKINRKRRLIFHSIPLQHPSKPWIRLVDGVWVQCRF